MGRLKCLGIATLFVILSLAIGCALGAVICFAMKVILMTLLGLTMGQVAKVAPIIFIILFISIFYYALRKGCK